MGRRPAAARALAARGIRTVAQLRARDHHWLVARFGRLGAHLHEIARGHDPRPVTPLHETKSVSAETTFARDISRRDDLEAILWQMARRVMESTFEKGLAGHVVTVKLKHADFATRTASTTLAEPTLLAGRIFRVARPLLARLHGGASCRLVGVGISRLVEADEKMLAASLDERAARQARAELAMEDLRRRLGADIVDLGFGWRQRR